MSKPELYACTIMYRAKCTDTCPLVHLGDLPAKRTKPPMLGQGLLPEPQVQWRRRIYTRETWWCSLRTKWSRIHTDEFGRRTLLRPDQAKKAIYDSACKRLGDSAVLGQPELAIRINLVTNTPIVVAHLPVYRDVKPEHREIARSMVNRIGTVAALEVVEKVE